MADQTLSVKIIGDSSSFEGAVTRAQGKLDAMDSSFAKLGKADHLKALGSSLESLGNKITSVGTSLTTKITLPIAAAAGMGVKKFAEVDKTMQLTNATMGNSEKQAKLLEKAMKEAAAQSIFGMDDAATATLNFARAGLTAEQAAATLAPAMNLAAGEGGNLDTVSAGLVATINGFGDSFSNAEKYANVFANACNNSALDIDALSQSMSIAAPIFKTAGYSINDAALYMGVMANAGIPASEAANSLKTGLARLVSPAKDGAAWLDTLGVSVTKADGSMKDSITIQKELHDAFAGLSESEQMAAASAIFGKNQMSKWLALINTSPDEVSKLSASLEDMTTVQRMADAMMSGFGGSLEKLKSQADVAATSFGQALAPSLSKVVDKASKVLDAFNNMSEEQQQTVAKIALMVAAIGPLLVVFGTLTSKTGSIIKLFSQLSAGTTGASSVMSLFGGHLGAIAGIAAGVIAAFVLLYQNSESFRNAVNGLVGTALTALMAIFQALKPAIDAILQAIGPLAEAFGTALAPMINMVSTVIQILTPILAALVGAFAEVVQAITPVVTWLAEMHTKITGPVFEALGGLSDKLKVVGDWFKDMGKKSKEASDQSQQATAAQRQKAEQDWDAMKIRASQMWDSIKSKTSSTWSSITNRTQVAGSAISAVWSGLKATATSTWEGIKSTVTSKIQAAATKVKSIWQTVHNVFAKKISLPHIKLPHISVSGSFSLNPPSAPSFSISWWKTGAIFNAPSVIGVGEGNEPEAVTPISKLKAYVTEAVTNANRVPVSTPSYIDGLASAIAAGFSNAQTPGGGEYHIDISLGGTRVAQAIYELNKQGELIMRGA